MTVKDDLKAYQARWVEVDAIVVRTVALEQTLENIAALGLLVVVRTFLSWSLVVEREGRWPWQVKMSPADEPGELPSNQSAE